MRQTLTTRTPFDERAEPKRRPQRVVRSPSQAKGYAKWVFHGVRLSPAVPAGQAMVVGRHFTCHLREGVWPKSVKMLDSWLIPSAQDAMLFPNISLDHAGVILEGNIFSTCLLDALVSEPFTVEAPVRGGEGSLDRAQRELARLKDGWAGPDSLAPLPRVLADLSLLLPIIPAQADPPEFEVDGSDGALTLVWHSGPKTFSMTLVGNGKVVGIMSPSNGYRAWTLAIAKEIEIAEKLEDLKLSSLLGL